MQNNPKEKMWSGYDDYDFVSKLSNRKIKDAIKILRCPPVYGVDENTRLASLRILKVELAARHSGAVRFSGHDVSLKTKNAREH